MSAYFNHNRSQWVLESDKGMYAVTASVHSLYELDRQSLPSWQGWQCWELQDQPFSFCRRFGVTSIFSTGPL